MSDLKEINTEIKYVKIDQGMVDQYFKTDFSVRHYFDDQHPMNMYITVKSAQYAFYNGKNTEVISVEGDTFLTCP